MDRSERNKPKRWSLKTLLLVLIFPVFVGAGATGILFNYFMARDNAQQRIDDHILRRRMDLKFLAMLPTLTIFVDGSRSDDAGFLRQQTESYVVEYLKSLSPSFAHTLRIITMTGETLLYIEDGELVGQRSDRVPMSHIKALALLQPDQLPELPTYAYPPDQQARISDLLPLHRESDRALIGALVYEYGLPVEQLMAPVRETLAFNIFLAVTTLFIALVITYLILEMNINPLRELTRQVQKMIGGDMSQPVTVKSRGETKILSLSFETLRKRLKQQIELLETNTEQLERSLSEARQAKDQLQQERDYSAGIIAESPNLICGIATDATVTFMNPAGEELTGYTTAELHGKDVDALLFPQDREPFVAQLFQDAAQKGIYNREKTITTATGRHRTLLWSSLHRRDEKQRIIEIILIGNDITEIKEAENELRKFRTISDRSSYGSAIYDVQGQITYINEAYAVMHGYRPDELIGKHMTVFFGSRYVQQHDQLYKQLMLRGRLTAEEVVHITKDGTTIPLLISSTLVRNDYGQPFFLSETAIDISEKKALEEQLQIRQRMDSLGTLAAGITHDFNNLLSGITGYLDLLHLRSDNFTTNQKRYLNQLSASVQHATELIRQFQILSQGNVSKKRYLDISHIVDDVFNFLKKTTDRMIQKQNSIEPGRFYVKGNQTELSQVLLNLAVNAKEAIETKGVTRRDYIRVQARNVLISETKDKTLKGGRYVHLTFSDSGCGMTEAVKARAFDPLFSLKKMGQRRGQGLGLAMVYNIIKNHNGHVSVDSLPGEGATFHVYLPAAAPIGIDAQISTDLTPGHETLLLVDDEKMLRDVIREELEQLGYTVITASDGLEAMETYKARMHDIHLVIADIIMPQLSGDMLAEQIRAINPDAAVILTSGKNQKDVSANVLAKVDGFLQKPLVLKELAATLRQVLNGK